MPQLLQLQNYLGKGMEDGKKVSLCRFLAGQKIASSWKKNAFWGILSKGLQKCL